MERRDRALLAAGGAAGTALWALLQPIDQRLLRRGYDDVELLGWLVRPDGRGARRAGWLLHVTNGALFGLAYSELHRRLPRDVSPRRAALAMAQVEHVGLYPLAALLDRVHPARGRVAAAFGPRQFVQAAWRHAILGMVLGEVAARVARRSRA